MDLRPFRFVIHKITKIPYELPDGDQKVEPYLQASFSLLNTNNNEYFGRTYETQPLQLSEDKKQACLTLDTEVHIYYLSSIKTKSSHVM